jgi:hypothetical protein
MLASGVIDLILAGHSTGPTRLRDMGARIADRHQHDLWRLGADWDGPARSPAQRALELPVNFDERREFGPPGRFA